MPLVSHFRAESYALLVALFPCLCHLLGGCQGDQHVSLYSKLNFVANYVILFSLVTGGRSRKFLDSKSTLPKKIVEFEIACKVRNCQFVYSLASFPGSTHQLFSQCFYCVSKAGEWSLGTRLSIAYGGPGSAWGQLGISAEACAVLPLQDLRRLVFNVKHCAKSDASSVSQLCITLSGVYFLE